MPKSATLPPPPHPVTASPQPKAAAVSPLRLEECRESAKFWTKTLTPYSAKMQDLADRYAIAACLISTVTGLTAWGEISRSPRLWAQILVVVMAFAAAAVAVIPKIRGYGECAIAARHLSTEYGTVLGRLEDALAEVASGVSGAQVHADEAVAAFEAVRSKKNNLRPYPPVSSPGPQ